MAEKDFELLRKMLPRSHAAYFGLGEVAYRKKDYSEAVEQYQNYLKYVPESAGPELAEEKKQVMAKLEESKSKAK